MSSFGVADGVLTQRPNCRLPRANGPQPASAAALIRRQRCSTISRRDVRSNVSTIEPPATQQGAPSIRTAAVLDGNQRVREGATEASLVQRQASKRDPEQPDIASVLQPLVAGSSVDVIVVGCGPAGLFLAAELAKRGLQTGLVGADVPFVNNYGVWVDEFKALGLEHTLQLSYDDALCYFGESKEVRVGREYGRVCRRKLRAHLLGACEEAGVRFMAAEVTGVELAADGASSSVVTAAGQMLSARLVTLAAGAAAGKFLRYEPAAPGVAAQTAYGIEAEVEGYGQAYDPNLMLFMDFRRHHTGVWDGTASRLTDGTHPNAGGGMWGASNEVPSFLYAMPLGGNKVFLQETCLVAKPPLPFAILKRRLERRLKAMGVKVNEVEEEEWSFIPVGGPMPIRDQPITAFGAAANMVHPATGFSIARSLRDAPGMADAVAAALKANLPVAEASAQVWDALWPEERRRQAAFHVFGMELLTQLDLPGTNGFFSTFFSLPSSYWQGFLSSSLDSSKLLAFAAFTFFLAPLPIKARLIGHLMTDPAGRYLISTYMRQFNKDSNDGTSTGGGSSAQTAMAAALAAAQLAAMVSSDQRV